MLAAAAGGVVTAVMATDVDSVTNSQLTYSVSDANFTVQTINNIAYIRTAQSVTLLSSSVRIIITTIIICMSSLVFLPRDAMDPRY